MPNLLSVLIPIEELKIGMYVLDVKSKNRFIKIKTKGLVKSNKIIVQLKEQKVTHVVIKDVNYSDNEEESNDDIQTLVENSPPASTASKPKRPFKKTSVEEEFKYSCEVYNAATESVKSLFNDISIGQPINTNEINSVANNITDSLLRNEYAISILTRIREEDSYQWEHAINSAILASGFSLYIGMKPKTAMQIALGALLNDIGNAKLPQNISKKADVLSHDEKALLERHVLLSHKICKKDGISNRITTDMVVNHHERLDGSGYPRGINSNDLSKLARFTAIIDVYDAMTGNKPHKKAELPIDALRYLIANNEQFDKSLVQRFIKYIGVHPVGSLIKLSNDTLAIVVEGNRENPLNPTVTAFYSTIQKKRIPTKKHILDKESLNISFAADPQDYHLNIADIIKEILV